MSEIDRLNRLKHSFHPMQWFVGEDELDLYVSNKEDAFMWVYIKNKETGRYEVGFFTPDKDWCPESDYETAEAAARRVNYLMGGR
jgi:hypothetical protein